MQSTAPSTLKSSFASRHADPSRGFTAVPRWFRESDFWKSLSAVHRAVLDELYHRIARVDVTQKGTGIRCLRGQWAMGLEALGAASGATRKQARTAISSALKAGVIEQAIIAKRMPTRTLHLSLFTWLDFDTYDRPWDAEGHPQGHSMGHPPGLPVGQVKQHGNTPWENKNGNTWSASPPAGFAGEPSGSVLAPPIACNSRSHEQQDAFGRAAFGNGHGFDAFGVPVEANSQKHTATAGSVVDTGVATGPAVPSGPSVGATLPGKSSKAATGARRAAVGNLSEDEKAKICATAAGMETYLLWGIEAIRGFPTDQLTPCQTNWRRFNGTTTDPKAQDWDIPAFTGYYWFRVSKYREKRRIPITVPLFSRLVGDMKNLLTTMSKKEVHLFISVVCSHFDLIQWMCGNAGNTMGLNESSLSHGLIKSTACNIRDMSDEERGTKYAEMRSKLGLDLAA